MTSRRPRLAHRAPPPSLACCCWPPAAPPSRRPPPAPAAPRRTAAGPISLTDSRGKEVDAARRRPPGWSALEWNVAEHAVVARGDAGRGRRRRRLRQLGQGRAAGRRGRRTSGCAASPASTRSPRCSPDLILATDELPDTRGHADGGVRAGGVREGRRREGQPSATMRRNLEFVARATGKEAEAAALLADVRRHSSPTARRSSPRRRRASSFVFTDAYVEGSQVSIRPFAKGSLISDVTEQLGLTNAWTEPGDEVYGLGETDVEGLTAVGGTDHFLYIANAADGGDPFADELADNAVWKSLPVVQEGRVERMPDGIWMFGGPTSMRAVRRRARDHARRVSPPTPTLSQRHRDPAGRRARPGGCAWRPSVRGRPGRRRCCSPRCTSPRARRTSALGDLLRLLLGGAGTEQEVAVVRRLPGAAAAGRGAGRGGARACPGRRCSRWRATRSPSPDTLGVDAGAYLLLVLAIALRLDAAGAVRRRPGLPRRPGRRGAGADRWPPAARLRADPAGAGRLGDRDGAGLGHGDAAAAVPRADDVGLFAWGSGSLGQYGLTAVTWMGPLVAAGRRPRWWRCRAGWTSTASATTPPPCSGVNPRRIRLVGGAARGAAGRRRR